MKIDVKSVVKGTMKTAGYFGGGLIGGIPMGIMLDALGKGHKILKASLFVAAWLGVGVPIGQKTEENVDEFVDGLWDIGADVKAIIQEKLEKAPAEEAEE